MSYHEWDSKSIDHNKICKISQARRLKRSVFWVRRDTVYLSPLLDLIEEVYDYQDPTSDDAILSEINPLLVQLKELCIVQGNIEVHDN